MPDPASLSIEERLRLFDELIGSSTKMATMVRNFGRDVDERFEGMILEPLGELQEVLSRCPIPGAVFDGTLRDEDIEITYYLAPAQTSGEEPKGVKMRHKILDVGAESYSKISREQNAEVARGALEKMVKKEAGYLQA